MIRAQTGPETGINDTVETNVELTEHHAVYIIFENENVFIIEMFSDCWKWCSVGHEYHVFRF